MDLLCGDQAERWLAGERIPAEAYLRLHPRLRGEDEAAFELVYSEYVLRESLGEAPTPEEFAWRFPEFAERLRRQIGLHQALDSAGGPDGLESHGAERTVVGPGVAEDDPDDPRFPAIPGYRIESEIGRGATGVVYRARDLDLNRLVALKVIRLEADPVRDEPGFGTEAESVARFRIEAEAVARLQHPNIVQIYEIGEHDGLGLPGPGVRRGGEPGPAARRHAAGPAPGGAGWSEALARAIALRPPARDRPPRPQAGQRPAGRRRHAQGRRLRPGEAAGRRPRPDPTPA